MNKAVILGCGYVGMAVAERWRRLGLTVTGTTTSPGRLAELEAQVDEAVVIRGSDHPALQTLLADQEALLVCVGAGRNNRDYVDAYLKTAETLAGVLPQTTVQQVIFTSTYSIYGDHAGAWVNEDTPIRPATERAEVLAAAEQALLATSAPPSRRVCVFRLGGIYGLGRELARIFARSAGKTRPGSGNEGSNWVHLDDIAGAIEFARTQQLAGIYNLVQDEIPTVAELIQRVCVANQLDPITWDVSQPSDRPYNVRCSNHKLKAAGYAFSHPRFLNC